MDPCRWQRCFCEADWRGGRQYFARTAGVRSRAVRLPRIHGLAGCPQAWTDQPVAEMVSSTLGPSNCGRSRSCHGSDRDRSPYPLARICPPRLLALVIPRLGSGCGVSSRFTLRCSGCLRAAVRHSSTKRSTTSDPGRLWHCSAWRWRRSRARSSLQAGRRNI